MKYPKDLVPSDFIIKHWVLNSTGVRKIHVCAISNPGGVIVGTGHAICSPEDKYIAERGREIAQGRAIKSWSGHSGIRETYLEFKTFRDKFDERIDRAMDQAIEEIYVLPAVLGGPDYIG